MSPDVFAGGLQVLTLVYAMLIIALFLAFLRLARGPSLPDRVVALDLIAVITVGMIATYAINVEQQIFIDAALIVALIAFLGTVAFAQYIERSERND
jgi:multicomponent Na+:H+ antiporter subunit F